MYGLVNKALEDMVIAEAGEETWERIKTEAGVDIELFLSHTAYPDEVTYSLLGAANRVLKVPVDELLERFGVRWVLHTAAEGYGAMMDSAGKTLGEFLENLPNFHTSITLIFPDLVPPRFEYSDVQKRSVNLHYYSERSGLAPFVVGLLKGLGERFGTPVRVTHTLARGEQGADHDEFRVEWEEEPA